MRYREDDRGIMTNREASAMDRHITGNYGEDSEQVQAFDLAFAPLDLFHQIGSLVLVLVNEGELRMDQGVDTETGEDAYRVEWRDEFDTIVQWDITLLRALEKVQEERGV